MAAFDLDDELSHPIDFMLLQNGHVVLFRRPEVLRSALDSLRDLGYTVIEVDASLWGTVSDLHDDLAASLDFPDYYGRNFNATLDCLRDVATYDYGCVPGEAGLAVAVSGFDQFAARDREAAEVLTDVFAVAARHGLLFGHRMLLLLQVSDGTFTLPHVGATPVDWNSQEWLRTARET